jgi:hypothetical protein
MNSLLPNILPRQQHILQKKYEGTENDLRSNSIKDLSRRLGGKSEKHLRNWLEYLFERETNRKRGLVSACCNRRKEHPEWILFLRKSKHAPRCPEVKAGNPAVSSEIRGFPTPPHDGCGFFNFPFPTGK